MTETLYLATHAGLVVCQRDSDSWRVADRVLKDHHVTSVMARAGTILAGTTAGIQRSDDNGQHWHAVNEGLASPHIRWLAYHPDMTDLTFAGTEPANIFVSRDGGEHWSARPEVAELRDQIRGLARQLRELRFEQKREVAGGRRQQHRPRD